MIIFNDYLHVIVNVEFFLRMDFFLNVKRALASVKWLRSHTTSGPEYVKFHTILDKQFSPFVYLFLLVSIC